MSADTWILFAAIVLGPAIGVCTTFGVLHLQRTYQRRVDVFRTMLANRRLWLSQEWIGSLNLVSVEFAFDDGVIKAYESLLARYSDSGWKGNEDERRRMVLDTESAASELLLRMASALKIELRGPDLRARPNTPYGWSTDEVQQRLSRDLAMQVLQGARPLKVELSAPVPMRQHEPQRQAHHEQS